MTLPGLACDDEAPPGGAAGALERERRLNAALLDTVRALTVILDREGRIVRFNRACRHLTGLEEAEAVGRAFHDVLPMVDGEDTGGRLKGLLAGEEQPDTESTLIVKGGERRRISWTSAVLRDAAGAIEQVVCMGVDVTSQRQAQREVTEAVRRLEDAVDGMSESFCLYDADDRLVLFNRQFAEIYRDGRHIVRRGRRFEDVLRDLAAAGWFAGETDDVDELVEQRLRQHRAADGIPIRRQLPDGRWMQIREYATREGGIVGIATDITALVEQAKQLSDSERQLRLISDNLPAAIAYVDAGYRLRYVSRTGERWLGRPADELRGRHLAAVLSRRLFVLLKPSMERALAGEQVSAEHEPAGFDSPIRCIEAHYVPDRAEDGTVRGFYALLTDVTERRALQEQLHEAQKIEAIGQLTGGVAHDFNNLLGIIIGNLDLLLADLRQDPGASELLERAISSAERGASQTQKLLAFARRQSLLPRITDVGRLIGEAADLLKRTLGADIALQTRVADNLWPALVDPGQLEAALVNLVVNARDATPGGGRVVIDARNLRPGQQLDK
ncbi:MAG TPA: PAS domain-containing protein, partial [Alphaproteobacteria bacterium]|nr:PAS domain-containing protein [Alphaproteobacteria bacterium]